MDASTISSAFHVLTNPTLFSLTTTFQRGVPLWVVDYECRFSSLDVSLPNNDRAKRSMETTGLLPRLAIQNHDLDTLEKLLDLSTQEYGQSHAKFSFNASIDDAAKVGNLEILQWLRDIAGAAYQRGTIDSTARNGRADAMMWLLANFPECNDEITAALMDAVAGNGDLDVVHILHEWSPEGCTTQAMDDAAANGHLDVVVFLSEHRVEGCTTAAIDRAACNGHLHVIEWLLLLRDEGFTEEASAGAIMNGHAQVLQCLWENRGDRHDDTLRAGISKAVPQALSTMTLAMAVLVYDIAPEAFPVDAIPLAQAAGCDDVAEYLRAVGTFRDGEDALLLGAAARQDHTEIQAMLDREVFGVDVLREALVSTKSSDDATSESSDPAVFAVQIRLQQLIDQQIPVEDEVSCFLPLKTTGSPSGSRRSRPSQSRTRMPKTP